MSLNFFNKLIKEICLEKSIDIEFLSYEYIIKLTKNSITRYIIGSSFGNNSSSSSRIALDKCCTYEVLKSYNIPVAENNFINTIDADLKFTSKYNYDVVVKPNRGMEGIDVLHLTNLRDIQKEVNRIVKYEKSVTICPFYNIKNEYRTFYLDGECLLTYSKERPYVIGDGKNNVKKLIVIHNLKNIDLNELTEKELKYIPRKGEQVLVSWKHNLCFGAKPKIITDKNKLNEIHELAKKAGQAIEIKFATIDIIELYTGQLMILEINSSVTFTKFSEYAQNGEKQAKEIYTKAIDKLFE